MPKTPNAIYAGAAGHQLVVMDSGGGEPVCNHSGSSLGMFCIAPLNPFIAVVIKTTAIFNDRPTNRKFNFNIYK